MKKTKISFYFVFISFFTLLTIFFSIVQKSYFSFMTPQKIIEKDALLNDFNPNLDLTVISTIESKNKNIDESFDFSTIKSNQASTKSTPTPTITPQITENSTSKETVAETEIAPTSILTPTPILILTLTLTPTPQITKNPTSKEAVTIPVSSVKSGGSASTSTQ